MAKNKLCKPLPLFNSSPPEQNGLYFSDDIFVNEKCCILIEITLKFITKGPIDNNTAFA